MRNTVNPAELLQVIIVLLLLTALTMFFYAIVQPAQHEKASNKAQSRPMLTAEEIDNLFDAVDPINETLPQRFSNN